MTGQNIQEKEAGMSNDTCLNGLGPADGNDDSRRAVQSYALDLLARRRKLDKAVIEFSEWAAARRYCPVGMLDLWHIDCRDDEDCACCWREALWNLAVAGNGGAVSSKAV